jgi:predicted esterase
MPFTTPVAQFGANLTSARLAVVMLHGRGASAQDMINLAQEIRILDVAYIAPQAPGNTWYPLSFLAPIPQNEPALSHALETVDGIVSSLLEQRFGSDRVALMGFSQGACLSLEYSARHARRYAAVIGLSGGLIGPPGTPRNYTGSLDGTPVFLGCSDVDSHIPLERVHETTEVLRRMGATVDERIYEGMGHTVNVDELKAVRAMLGSSRVT